MFWSFTANNIQAENKRLTEKQFKRCLLSAVFNLVNLVGNVYLNLFAT